jgi:hypothetical protein
MAKKSPHKQVAKIIDYKGAFGTEQGQRVLHDLCKTCGLLITSFDENPHMMAFKEGQRNVVLHILNKLKMDPMALKKFIEERENEE